jgi:hypothetical protein
MAATERGNAGKAEETARKVDRETRDAAASPVFEIGMRWGYVVRGLLYGAMGVLAVLLAVGRVGHTTDQKGSFQYFVNNSFGHLLLGVFAFGLAAYSLWGFVRAVYDPLNRGDKVPGLAARLGFAWSGIAYASLVLTVLQVLLGAGGSLESDSVQGAVAAALAKPIGRQATAVAGVVAIVAGLAQFADAWRASFKKDLNRGRMSEVEYRSAILLGRLGMASRGVVFTMTGWFILQAALHQDAGQAHGLGKTFEALLRQPAGHLTVALVGIGFIALALHSVEYARRVRMMPHTAS